MTNPHIPDGYDTAEAFLDEARRRFQERYGAIRETIAELKGAVHSAGKMLAGLALALLAWGASQIYADLKAARANAAPPATAAP